MRWFGRTPRRTLIDERDSYKRWMRQAEAHRDHLDNEIRRLADFIMDEIDGEPSQGQGAVDTAIRIMRALAAREERR